VRKVGENGNINFNGVQQFNDQMNGYDNGYSNNNSIVSNNSGNRSVRSGRSNRDKNDVLKAGDILEITATPKIIAKVRFQCEGFVPASPFRLLMGRLRHERALCEVVATYEYQGRDNILTPAAEKALSVELFKKYGAMYIGTKVRGPDEGGNHDNAPLSSFLVEADPVTLEAKMAATTDSSTTSDDNTNNNDLVRRRSLNNLKLHLICRVPLSNPPRSETTIDKIRGMLILGLFLVSITLAALASPFPVLNHFKDVHIYFFWLAIICVWTHCLTWKQALSSISAPVVLVFMFGTPFGAALRNSGAVVRENSE
jgi:hypothetical protein